MRIQLLGELAVWQGGERVTLPASKKTRALLAYLVMTDRPQRRDRLCEIFWDIPDDPRGALRWSLSKLRSVVNDADFERIVADRERVGWQAGDCDIDLSLIEQRLDGPGASHGELTRFDQMLQEPLLAGGDLPEQPVFQNWLTAERHDVEQLAGRVAQHLALHPKTAASDLPMHCRRWLDLGQLEPLAGARLLDVLRHRGHPKQAVQLEQELAMSFANTGQQWPPEPREAANGHDPLDDLGPLNRSVERRLLARQKIQFCTTEDGTRIAYASVGEGPPLVKAANWLNHLELDWHAPIWSPLFQELARDHQFIRYDERGNGLSDWDVAEITPQVFVTDLETVADAAGLESFPLLGISQGASVSIEYAVRHPDRVSHLILFGAYAAGWRVGANDEEIREREAIMTLTKSGWGRDNPAYRHIFSSTFMPTATLEELNWFDDFQRQTTSPSNAVRFLSAFGDIDVRDLLPQVTVPTLVIHSRGDARIPLDSGRDIAAAIPGAEFVSLDSDNHLLLGREPASRVFVAAVRRFLGTAKR